MVGYNTLILEPCSFCLNYDSSVWRLEFIFALRSTSPKATGSAEGAKKLLMTMGAAHSFLSPSVMKQESDFSWHPLNSHLVSFVPNIYVDDIKRLHLGPGCSSVVEHPRHPESTCSITHRET